MICVKGTHTPKYRRNQRNVIEQTERKQKCVYVVVCLVEQEEKKNSESTRRRFV